MDDAYYESDTDIVRLEKYSPRVGWSAVRRGVMVNTDRHIMLSTEFA